MRPVSAILVAVALITPCLSFAQSVGGGGGSDRPTKFVIQKGGLRPREVRSSQMSRRPWLLLQWAR